MSGVEVRKCHALGDDASDRAGDHGLVIVLTMIRAVAFPDIDRNRRANEGHQLLRYPGAHIANIDLEALRAVRVRRDSPRCSYSSSVTFLANDALALDDGLQVSDTRFLTEIAQGFSLEFRHCLSGTFNGGRNVGVDYAFRTSARPSE